MSSYKARNLLKMSLRVRGRIEDASFVSGEQASERRWDCSGLPPVSRGPKVLRHQIQFGPAIQFLHNLFYVSNWHMARYQLCIIIIIIIIKWYSYSDVPEART